MDIEQPKMGIEQPVELPESNILCLEALIHMEKIVLPPMRRIAERLQSQGHHCVVEDHNSEWGQVNLETDGNYCSMLYALPAPFGPLKGKDLHHIPYIPSISFCLSVRNHTFFSLTRNVHDRPLDEDMKMGDVTEEVVVHKIDRFLRKVFHA